MYSGMKTKCLAAYTEFLAKMAHSKSLSVNAQYHQGTYLDINREEIADTAIEDDYDYLFFIDSDMIFKKDILERLYDRHKDVVGAIYSLRCGKTHGPSIYDFRPERGDFVQYKYWPINKFLKVDGIATGLLLIKVEALKKIPAPRFAYLECMTPDKHGNRRRLGEDLSFCIRCRENNIRIYADGTIWTGHLGEHVYTHKDFQMRQIIEKEGLKNLDILTIG